MNRHQQTYRQLSRHENGTAGEYITLGIFAIIMVGLVVGVLAWSAPHEFSPKNEATQSPVRAGE